MLRNQMPVVSEWAYFDHAAVSPLPRDASEAAMKMLQQSSDSGDYHWPDWSIAAGKLRANAAELLHCSTSEIALVPNTTFGINLIANTFPWFAPAEDEPLHLGIKGAPSGTQNPDVANPNVVVIENEFSSNLLAWENLASYGVEVRKVTVEPNGILSLDRLREKIDAHTRLVSVSWVNYLTGYRIDLEKVCSLVHEAGAQLFLDAIQGLGVFPCDVSQIPIDYVAADGHKWMLGPEGAGILYIRKDRIGNLAPAMLGWNSLRAPHQFSNQAFEFKDDASRFEGGSANHVGMIAFEKSLRLLLDLGCHLPGNGVEAAVLENAAYLQSELESIGAVVYRDEIAAHKANTHLSGIVCFTLPGKDPVDIRSELIRNKVVSSVRHGRVRLATHAYNTSQEVHKLVSVLRQC